ncbi:MAG: hypothetical protein WCK83_16915, partial [Burkholderiales bacterium]
LVLPLVSEVMVAAACQAGALPTIVSTWPLLPPLFSPVPPCATERAVVRLLRLVMSLLAPLAARLPAAVSA